MPVVAALLLLLLLAAEAPAGAFVYAKKHKKHDQLSPAGSVLSEEGVQGTSIGPFLTSSSSRATKAVAGAKPGRRKARSPKPPPPSPPPSPAPLLDPSRPRPNIVLLLVDDQDYLLNATHKAYMPLMHKHIASKGLHLNNFIVTTSVCCPSRVNLLTGKFTHNTNVTSNQPPIGGWRKFRASKLDSEWLPKHLTPLGYRSYFTGKFLNLFDLGPGDDAKCPQGFTVFDPLTDSTVYQYVNFDFLYQCSRLDSYRKSYQTDVLRDRSLQYINDAVAQNAPFYLQVNPAACHTTCAKGEDGGCFFPVPAQRHLGRFANTIAPRTANWLKPFPDDLDLKKKNDKPVQVGNVDKHYQARLETMLAVDEMIDTLVTHLDNLGILNNTYFMYVSDNGYHLGNHNLEKGKQLPIEEDVRVPFYIRGPGIPEGITHPYMATIVDLTSTVVTLAGGTPPSDWDGLPIPFDRIADGTSGAGRYPNFPKTQGPLRQTLPIEMWASAYDKKIDRKDYRSVRVCTNYTLFSSANASSANMAITAGGGTCWKYTVWCVPTLKKVSYHELYDLGTDPAELNDRYPLVASDARVARLVDRLDALVQVLGYCKGSACHNPWRLLHPAGDVSTFEEAMLAVHDARYSGYTKFAWRSCARYMDPKLEVRDIQLTTAAATLL